jgi:hypothetical protein
MRLRLNDPVAWFAGAALVLGVFARLNYGRQGPLWLDETFSAAIATEPTFAAMIRWCLNDPNGPLYYILLWCWAHLFGASDLVLRLPSFICALAAPVFLAVKGHPKRNVRLLWASLACLWLPGIGFASDARTYALLFLLSCLQTTAYIRLWMNNTVRAAWLWSIVTSLAILAHYHSLIISGLEGAFYVALRPRQAGKAWLAALAFVPTCIWMSIHLPVLLAFASPSVAWYKKLSGLDLLMLPSAVMGASFSFYVVLLATIGTWLMQFGRAVSGSVAWPYRSGDTVAVASGILAILVICGIAFVTPSFSSRYLIPCIPALLFGLALMIDEAKIELKVLMISLLVLPVLASLAVRDRACDDSHCSIYNFSVPSRWLEVQGVKRLMFFWDNPGNQIVSRHHLEKIGSFFLRRDGYSVPTVAISGRNRNPNRLFTQFLTRPGDAFMWAFDRNVSLSAGNIYPPMRHFPGMACRNFGNADTTILACVHQ